MAKFELKDLLNSRSVPEKVQEQKIVYRNPQELIPSKTNFYSPELVNELAESILQFGQLDAILLDKKDGKDYIIAGHTRRLAMMKLIEEGHEQFKKAKCVYFPRTEIEQKFGTDADLAMELIEMQTNLYREKTDWEKMQEVVKTEEIVKKLKLPGKSRDNAAQILKISGGQAGRYHAVHANLCEQLMDEFRENRIKGSVAYELSKLSPEFQKLACELFGKDGVISLEDVKKLQAQENAEKSIPGQMSIAQATGKLRPVADTTPINVETQIKRFYDGAQKRLKERIQNRDKIMVPIRLKDLYNGSRIQNGYLNYRAEKACIVFNPETDQEKEIHWNDLADILIRQYGKKLKPVKMVSIDAPEKSQGTLTETEAVKALFKEYPDKLKTVMRICRQCKNNSEAAKAVQKKIAPYGWHAVSGGEVEYTFMGFTAGLEITVKKEKVAMKYNRLIVEAKNLYDPYSPEFDEERKEKEPAKCITGKSGSGICGASAYCDNTYNCCLQCPEDCNSRCRWIEESCQTAAETPDKKQQSENHSGEVNEMVESVENTDLSVTWPDCLKDLPIPTDTEVTDLLYRKETELKEMIKVEEEPGFPHMVLMQQQMIVAGLRIIKNIVEDEQEEPEQTPLPDMRNNDQRKEWLRNYKNWGIWYEDKNTGVRYYKYDFENGARLIAEEFDPDPVVNTQWYTARETYYLHLVGGPEPDKAANGASKWAYHTRYSKYPNSESELVEFLKEI